MNDDERDATIRTFRQAGKTNMVMDEMASQHELKPLAIHGNNVTVRDVFGRIHTITGVSPQEIKRLKAQGVPETFANRAERRAAARRSIRGRHGEATAPQEKGAFQEHLAQLSASIELKSRATKTVQTAKVDLGKYNLSGTQTGRLDSSKLHVANTPKPATWNETTKQLKWSDEVVVTHRPEHLKNVLGDQERPVEVVFKHLEVPEGANLNNDAFEGHLQADQNRYTAHVSKGELSCGGGPQGPTSTPKAYK